MKTVSTKKVAFALSAISLVAACGKMASPTNSISVSPAAWEEIKAFEDSNSGFASREDVVNGLAKLNSEGAAPVAASKLDSDIKLIPLSQFRTDDGVVFAKETNARLLGLVAAQTQNGGYTVRQYDTPIKNQGNRGWCTAFGTTAILENLINQKYKKATDLSEMSLFEKYQHYYTDKAVAAATSGAYMVDEATLPYSTYYREDEQCMGQYSNQLCNAPLNLPESKRIARGLGSAQPLKTQQDVMKALESGNPIVMDALVNSSWGSAASRRGMIQNQGSIEGGHAFALVGYEMDSKVAGGGYFIIKNSWGTQWGDKGYGYMSFDYCRLNQGCHFYKISDVDLKGATPADPSKPTPPPSDPTKPTATPTASPTKPAAALTVKLVLDGTYDGAQVFKLKVDAPAEKLANITQVTYGIHPAYRQYYMWRVAASAESVANGFESIRYATYSKGWMTRGAKIEYKDGTIEYVDGTLVNW